MSTQMPDTFIYENETYSIPFFQHFDDFFDIEKLGISPGLENTACGRGYVATFSIHHGKLALKALYTNNSNGKAYPAAINGVFPSIDIPNKLVKRYMQQQHWHCNDINLTLAYSGAIFIADNLTISRFPGDNPPQDYRKVIKLIFQDGVLIKTEDVSKLAEDIREKAKREKQRLSYLQQAVFFE